MRNKGWRNAQARRKARKHRYGRATQVAPCGDVVAQGALKAHMSICPMCQGGVRWQVQR